MIIGNFSVTDFNQLPSLGSGMGFRLPLAKQILAAQESLDFLEITADHFMEMSRQREKLLDQLKSQYTLIPHGLSLSLGSAEGLNSAYLRQLTDLVERVNPPWWSEHISFSKAGGVEIGHLSPVPFNGSGLKALCENIRIATESIARPLILENITYTMALPWNEIDEAEFLSELLDRTGSGLLLDVTNLYTNSENHKYDAVAFLDHLPADRVVQLHYVGGEQREGKIIDNHSHATPEPVWALLGEVFKRFPIKGAILERDANFPEFDTLLSEVERCRATAQKAGRWT